MMLFRAHEEKNRLNVVILDGFPHHKDLASYLILLPIIAENMQLVKGKNNCYTILRISRSGGIGIRTSLRS